MQAGSNHEQFDSTRRDGRHQHDVLVAARPCGGCDAPAVLHESSRPGGVPGVDNRSRSATGASASSEGSWPRTSAEVTETSRTGPVAALAALQENSMVPGAARSRYGRTRTQRLFRKTIHPIVTR